MPHDISICYGSQLHCWSCNEDEPSEPCYIWCFECRHVFPTAEDLLRKHNVILASLDMEPETDPKKVYCCPLCVHDF